MVDDQGVSPATNDIERTFGISNLLCEKNKSNTKDTSQNNKEEAVLKAESDVRTKKVDKQKKNKSRQFTQRADNISGSDNSGSSSKSALVNKKKKNNKDTLKNTGPSTNRSLMKVNQTVEVEWKVISEITPIPSTVQMNKKHSSKQSEKIQTKDGKNDKKQKPAKQKNQKLQPKPQIQTRIDINPAQPNDRIDYKEELRKKTSSNSKQEGNKMSQEKLKQESTVHNPQQTSFKQKLHETLFNENKGNKLINQNKAVSLNTTTRVNPSHLQREGKKYWVWELIL